MKIYNKRKLNSDGFSHFEIVLVILIIAAIAFVGVREIARSHADAPGDVLTYYGTNRLQSSFVFPSPNPNSPIVIFVHGGGFNSSYATWEAGDVKDLQSAGFTVFDVNYNTDTTTTPAFPLETNDIVAATNWAIRYGFRYNGDNKHIIMLGGSAGGTLVALAAEELNASKPDTVKTVVTLSSAMDFTQLPLDSTREKALGCLGDEHVKCTTALEAKWSPQDDNNITAANCPTDWLVINGSYEKQPVSQGVNMVNKLHALKCSARLVINTSPSTAHAFDYWNKQVTNIISYIKNGSI
jgi:acetyl esterase/lipase